MADAGIVHAPVRAARLPRWLTGGALAAAVIVLVLAPFLAGRWMLQPFPGLLAGPGLEVIDAGARGGAVQAAGIQPGDRITALNGAPLRTAADLSRGLQAAGFGSDLVFDLRRPDGSVYSARVPALRFPLRERVTFLYIPFLIGLVFLAAAVWSYAVRRRNPGGRLYSALCALTAIALAGAFDAFSSGTLVFVWQAALAAAGGCLVNLAFYFPREDPVLRGRAWLPVVPFGVSLLAALAAQVSLQTGPGWRISLGYALFGVLFSLVWLLVRRRSSSSSVERDQLRLAVLSGIAAFGPLLVYLLFINLFNRRAFPPGLILLPLLIFPAVIGYTIQRYRVRQTDYLLSRAALYSLLMVLTVAGYALITAGAALLLNTLSQPFGPVAAGLVFFAMALVFLPLRERIQKAVDRVFFRGESAYQERLQTFSGELTRQVELTGILATLRRYVQETLLPSRMHIYVYDPLGDQYQAAADENGAPTSDLRFPSNSALAVILGEQNSSVVVPDLDALPRALSTERARLALLGVTAFVPLPGRQRLGGWLALGARLSGEPYSDKELGFLDSLCDQAALAIERAQVLANMEARVRQMDVLARVAQGANVTVSLDDILELTYAQTTQVIPADTFRILLYTSDQDLYQFAFYLSGEDRDAGRENRPIAPGETLEQEVARGNRPLRTDDYNRECQQRGLLISEPGLYSFMAVPLNAGAETIGAISMGSRDARVHYSMEQQTLAQSIADQVAGAIVKARLLAETERRALQLSTLNEVTRRLTSTLELEPLLASILNSAVDILSCEAGSLLLVDEATEEMVFRVVLGSAASTLTNRRLPPGSGVVGKAVKTREPFIVNDVTRFPEWFSQTDRQTGFVTRAVLVIPMIVKDRVIGVIEVLNKKDGSIFSRDDQDLLSAFTAQAAVAIDNARLYTLTDQALAARVEELSVMQRIDRELNTSLDVKRAMRITLEWAMRQSGAQAGLVGALEENGLDVVAGQGYGEELEQFKETPMPLIRCRLNEAVLEAGPVRRTLPEEPADLRLLPGAMSQTVIPIRRETHTIGLLLLESTSPEVLGEDDLNFLVRLSDHASIAIFNAQLYGAVQAANLAKSEFVSFVAHELKNPMTSVKGYTELLAAGAVGSINDAQGNFLNTIRTNIERMNTLVSDLNDMAKIEVGRLRLDFKPIALADVVETTVRSTRRQLEEKQQVLEVQMPAGLPPGWADRTRLEQVLVNLVSNAHKYTPTGGHIVVAAEHSANLWDATGAPEVLHLWVKDDGIGINEEDQKKIFQKFFRSDDPKTREAPGTGLGLNITKSLVEMQGGKIWFESEYRKGTTFHITVPVSTQ